MTVEDRIAQLEARVKELEAQKKQRKKKDPSAPKKPKTTYLLFCDKHRAEVQKKYPEAKMTEMSKHLGQMWGLLTPEQKAEYKA
jgi:hypothetical protein